MSNEDRIMYIYIYKYIKTEVDFNISPYKQKVTKMYFTILIYVQVDYLYACI